MANIKDSQQEAMASIDTAKALVDKVLVILQLVDASPTLSQTFATNPIGFLMQMLKHLGVTYEELRLWLTNFLIYVLPSLEISVKAILLTNLKHMISCSIDPRIPDKYRKIHKAPTDYNTSQEYGIDINLESIDFLNKLNVSPLSDEGREMYFGLEGVTDVYKFARADDFDAFLWFVMHKGHFPNSTKISSMTDINASTADTLLDTVVCNYSNSASRILVGNTFTYTGSSEVISMCIDAQYNTSGNTIIGNTLVPVSDDWNSVNWYARRADQLGKNIGFGWGVNSKGGNTKYNGKGRDYSKERAICNIQFLDQAISTDDKWNGLVNNKFRFTILPKPFVHIPNVDKGEPPWRFKKLLFDSKGNYDPNGKFTILPGTSDDREIIEVGETTIIINPNSGSVSVGDKNELVKHLVECYPGLTVFEFNYDYVMSLKLFDAKVIATTLLDSIIDARLGLNVRVGIQHQEATEQIKEIIKNIINSDDSAISDCFYSFDNSKYDNLLKRTEEKKAQYKKVSEILTEFNENAELHEQVDILNRAITQASVTVTDGIAEEDKTKVEFDFVSDLIERLTLSIVYSILSPKVLMLLEVNETIMGGKWEKVTLADIIKAMREVIVSIIKEIRDLILQELLKLVLKALSPIIATISSIIVREQLENYADAIADIIRNCPSIWFDLNHSYSETKLDTVDYADIDTSETNIGEKPIIDNC